MTVRITQIRVFIRTGVRDIPKGVRELSNGHQSSLIDLIHAHRQFYQFILLSFFGLWSVSVCKIQQVLGMTEKDEFSKGLSLSRKIYRKVVLKYNKIFSLLFSWSWWKIHFFVFSYICLYFLIIHSNYKGTNWPVVFRKIRYSSHAVIVVFLNIRYRFHAIIAHAYQIVACA